MELTEEEKAIINCYNESKLALKMFLAQVNTFFEENPRLNKKPFPIIHSIKSRYKDPDHLIDKIRRKAEEGRIITPENLLEEINDLIGIRVLYLYQDQFKDIHDCSLSLLKKLSIIIRKVPNKKEKIYVFLLGTFFIY